MVMGIVDAARRMGVSERRVRQLIAAGRLPAQRVGRQWVMDEADVAAREPGLGRPLSARSAHALIATLNGHDPVELSATERARLQGRVHQLRSAESPAALMRSWLVARRRVLRSVSSPDVSDLRSSGEVLLSGVSDPRAGMASVDRVEGYVARPDLAGLERRWLLVPADRSNCNVILHVVDELPESIGVGHIIADLAEHHSPRGDRQVSALVAGL